MNILIEGMSRQLGGMEAFIMSVYRGLDRENYRMDFIAYDDEIVFEDELKAGGSKVYHVTPRSKNVLQSRKELDTIFKQTQYDVFWTNKTTISNIEALKSAKKNQVPLRIVHSHSSENRGTKFTLFMHKKNRRQVANYANQLLACSKEAGVWMFGEKAKEAQIIINGVDIRKYTYTKEREEKMRKELGLGTEPVVGHVGRLSKEKNHSFLFRIFQEIQKKEPSAVLLLCGGGDEAQKKQLEEEAEALGISDSVRFLGVRRDVPDVLQVMNVFVFPSLFEGYPISLIEAQAAGLPTFGSKEAVPKEMGLTKEMHFLSLEEGEKQWAEAVLKELYSEKCSETEVLLQSEVSLEKMLDTIQKILEKRGMKHGN